MKHIQSFALAILALLATEANAGRGQILGPMNEVDEDNNIVGDVPFYNVQFPSKKSPTVEKVAFALKIILILVIIAGLIYGIILCYRKYGNRIKKVKIPKAVKKADSQPTFSVFKDEEAGVSTTDATSSQNKSM